MSRAQAQITLTTVYDGESALQLEIEEREGALRGRVYRGGTELSEAELASLGTLVWQDETGALLAEGLTPGLEAGTPCEAVLESRETLTGSFLSFTETQGRALRALAASVLPEQEGSGEPGEENLRPIRFRTELRLCRTGENLLVPRWDASRTVGGVTFAANADGSVTISGTSASATLFTPGTGAANMFSVAQPLPAGRYRLQHFTDREQEGVYVWLRRYDRFGKVLGVSATNNENRTALFTLEEDGYVFARLYANTAGTDYDCTVGVTLTRFDEAEPEAYTPADGEQFALDWGAGGFCGGELDAVTGARRALWYGYALSDAAGFTMPRAGTFRKALDAAFPYRRTESGAAVTVSALCDRFPVTTSDSVTAQADRLNFYNYKDPSLQAPVIYLRPEGGTLTSLEDFAAWIAEHPVRFCFELAEPAALPAAPRVMATRPGLNRLWADAPALRLTLGTALARAEHRPAQRLHIRYSDDGQSFTADGGRVVGAYIGTLVDTREEASAVFSDYTWRRFADDRELSGRLGAVEESVGDMRYEMRTDYLARSDFGSYAQQVTADIEANARAITESLHYAELVSAAAAAGVEEALTEYMTLIDGQIRRGYLTDPDTGETVIGIAVSQKLRFTGREQTVDGERCWELDGAQTFGLYTATGWQFWVGGRKIGWFDSTDGMLHVRQLAAEQELRLGADWLVTASGGFGIRYIGG